MKILYLFQIDPLKSVGIFNKITSKIRSLNAFSETKAINFSEEFLEENREIENVVSRKPFLKNLDDTLDKYASAYDFVVIRYPNASRELIRVLKKNPKKIIFEHNTLELNELRFNLQVLSFKDIGYLLKEGKGRLWNEYLKPYLLERMYGAKALSLARAGLCISNTVASFEKNKYSKYKALVQGNGIDLSEISVLSNGMDATNLRLLFISGSANKWHGVDRVLKGMLTYHGPKEIVLHLVGRLHHTVLELIKKIPSPHKVIIYGVVDRNEIVRIAEKCNLGIGSLALHRLGLVEGSTLKVREYMAMGLPFVLGYDDIDIPKIYKYALNINANDEPVDFL